MHVGIEKIKLYVGRLCLDIENLASARGKNPGYVSKELMCKSRSVYPVYEDAVTLAVNAAKKLITEEDKASIELVIAGTESAVDFGKPIAVWVHRYLGLQSNCRVLEVKHACYSGTGALKMAASWIASGLRPGKKALVVTSDISRSHLKQESEFICGGCGVAALISAKPDILEIELEKSGYWTSEIADTFRPTSKVEIGNNQLSLYSYLDALDAAYGNYCSHTGEKDACMHFKKHVYHAPFPGMTVMAHSALMNHNGPMAKSEIEKSFREKVEQGLTFAKRIGSAYGSSNFVCLLGLLHSAADIEPGDRISIFSYGSGCQGEFYSSIVGRGATKAVRSLQIDRHLSERLQLDVEEYEKIERHRDRVADCADFKSGCDEADEIYAQQYKGSGLLLLNEVQNYHRSYAWS